MAQLATNYAWGKRRYRASNCALTKLFSEGGFAKGGWAKNHDVI